MFKKKTEKEKIDLVERLELGEEYKSGNKKQVGDTLNLAFSYIHNSNKELIMDSELSTKLKGKIAQGTLEQALEILIQKKIIYDIGGSSAVRMYKKHPAAREYFKQNYSR